MDEGYHTTSNCLYVDIPLFCVCAKTTSSLTVSAACCSSWPSCLKFFTWWDYLSPYLCNYNFLFLIYGPCNLHIVSFAVSVVRTCFSRSLEFVCKHHTTSTPTVFLLPLTREFSRLQHDSLQSLCRNIENILCPLAYIMYICVLVFEDNNINNIILLIITIMVGKGAIIISLSSSK